MLPRNRSQGGKEGDRSMFSACVVSAKRGQLAEKWTSPRPLRERLLLLAVLALSGCINPFPAAGLLKAKSPLAPPQMSPDSVVLEMFFVRFPFGDPAVNEKLWEEIDEQQFAPDLRERLARNGFRVGLVSGQMPVELSKLLRTERQAGPERRDRGDEGRQPRRRSLA